MAEAKTVVGYCEPLSARAGGRVRLFASAHEPGPYRLDLVRLVCGDPSSRGPGLVEHPVAAALEPVVELAEQALTPGSCALAPPSPFLAELGSFTVAVTARPSLPGDGEQALVGAGGFTLGLDGAGAPFLELGSTRVTAARPLRANRWVDLHGVYDAEAGELILRVRPHPSRSPGADLLDASAAVRRAVPPGQRSGGAAGLALAARLGPDGARTHHFDGRLEAPRLAAAALDPAAPADRFDLRYDAAVGIGGDTLHDAGRLGLHAELVNHPARAVTGAAWDGTVQRWQERPEHYAAIHFHRDDLTDAAWEVTAEFDLPADLASGVYAFRLRRPAASDPGGEQTVDHAPFFVRPAPGAPTAAVAFLAPVCTYLAYANHRMLIEGADFFPGRSRLRPEHQYVRDHPEVGWSCYDHHRDRSGVMHSSRRRPILNLKPGADGWAFTADTNLVAFLERSGVGYDVITDEDLHHDGEAALAPYRVVVTGSHPEYWSTPMLDALEGWQRAGGRLMYLGGNGFYWRVAFSEESPWVMEVRRAEDGTRAWVSAPGEFYHQFGGEYGGLWRRLGRAPNLLTGVGFAAQGFDRAAPYARTMAAQDPRAAWIFDGCTEGAEFGAYGVGGGAAGQEIDRFDPTLGSPDHALVVAESCEHSREMLRTKEEFLATQIPPYPDRRVRADVVFYETPAGGAVFSVGSIAWFGALAHQGYDNDVARITENVLRRFADPTPFPPPAG
ncbi:MAG: N,N-dimethylformamidase beta subunit family domain-containing protein [Acidimicrobiales bacterium]